MGTTTRNWSDYNSHKRKELSTFIRESKKVLARLDERPPGPIPAAKPGRPAYPPESIFLANLLRVYLNLTYRDIEMLLDSNEQLRRRLGLKLTPSRDTLHRQAKLLTNDFLWRFNEKLTHELKKSEWTSPSTLRALRSGSTRHVGSLPTTP